jgi:hypothetical protein
MSPFDPRSREHEVEDELRDHGYRPPRPSILRRPRRPSDIRRSPSPAPRPVVLSRDEVVRAMEREYPARFVTPRSAALLPGARPWT